MGIERFFSSLDKNFNVITDLKSPYPKINCSHFFIDFNSIIHNVSSDMISKINLYKQKKIDKIEFDINNFELELINQVEQYIKNLLSDNLNSNKLEYLMLALDGVPTFAKIVEQKKRRYIGDLLSQLMKKFELPFEWSKNNISPGTEFMNKISLRLKEKRFLDECKLISKNLRHILISDIYNPGEGEMKIMRCLKSMENPSDYKICVYSPDSDMILLLMTLSFPVELLRYDQQKSQKEKEPIFNLIDVNKFKSELVNYCNKRIDRTNIKIEDKQLIDEIVYIFTLFGDDFLPKTESINVSEDVNLIIDNYLLTKIDKGNIINSKNNKYKINYPNLYYFFDLVSKNELTDLNRYFYNSKFKNYKWALDKNFLFDIKQFTKSVKNLYTESTNPNKDKGNLKNLIINATHIKQPYFNFMYNISKKLDGYQLYQFHYSKSKEMSKKENEDIKKYKSLYYLIRSKEELLEDLINYLINNQFEMPFQINEEIPESSQSYLDRSFEKKFHVNKMKKLELFNPGKERDQLEYLIQNKIDKYYNLFNPISFFYKTKITSTKKYYDFMFPNKDINDIIKKYIEGFEWILSYYFNNETDYLWFYPYSRTPLLSDVINKKIEPKLNFNFDEKNIFTPLELIIYITPIDSDSKLNFLANFINSSLKRDIYSFIENNLFMFINLKEIYFLLNSNPESLSDLLDCSVSIFLNKCHYKILERDMDPKLYLEKFRKMIPIKNQLMFNDFDLDCKKIVG